MYHHSAQFQGKRPAHHRDPPPSTTARRTRGVSVVGGPGGRRGMVKRKIRLGDVWCSAEKVLEVTVGCKLSMVKESEMAGLNDSDLRILRFLGKFRFVPTRVIETECFPAQSAKSAQAWTSRCLKKLRDNGLVERVQAFGGVWVHFLTECGSSLIGAEGGGGGVKLAEYQHDLLVLELWRVLSRRENVSGLVTERDARVTESDVAKNPYAIPVTRLSGKRGVAWPDLVSGERGYYTGYELEYSSKNRARLLHLMLGYGYAESYRIGVYFTVPASATVVTDCAVEANRILEDRGLGRPIAVRSLNDVVEVDL